MLDNVQAIRTVTTNAAQLQKLIDAGDFGSAIDLCKTCQQQANALRHFQSVKDMPAKFQETFELIEDKLDGKLTECCRKFKQEHYQQLLLGYARGRTTT